MARELIRRSLPSGRIARVVMSEITDGDAAGGDVTIGGPDDVSAAGRGRERLWTWLHQVHGDVVVVVDAAGGHSGSRADAAVTALVDAPLAVRVADCVPVALLGDRSVGVAHAGWRGLRAGVVERTIEAMEGLDGAPPVAAVVGPHIGPCCYEFGDADLDDLADRFGPAVRSTTTEGRPALDLSHAISGLLATADIPVTVDGVCTSCDDRYWSYRATATARRQAMVAWTEEACTGEA